MGVSGSQYTIIHCETGHYFESDHGSKDEFLWSEIFMFDSRTFYVLGNQKSNDKEVSLYKFYDWSDQKLLPLDIHLDHLPFDFDMNLPKPFRENDCLTFCVQEKRIHGIGKRKSDFDIKELDLSLEDYETQEQKEDGYTIFLSEEKEYQIDVVKIKMIRTDRYMEIIEFWMDKNFEKYFEKEIYKSQRKQKQKELEEGSKRYQKIKSILETLSNKFRKIQYNSIESGDKICNIHLMPLDTKSYHYHLSFSYLDDSQPLSIEFHNLRKLNFYNNKITYWTEEYTLDFISD